MEYWWLVRENLLDYVKLPVPELNSLHIPLWLLVISALAFVMYLWKFHGFTLRRLLKVYFFLWFAYTVVFANLVLLMLIGLIPVGMSVTPQTLVVNMFTSAAAAALLAFANVFGLVEVLVDLVPKFLLSAGGVSATTLETISVIVTAVLVVLGAVIFAYCA